MSCVLSSAKMLIAVMLHCVLSYVLSTSNAWLFYAIVNTVFVISMWLPVYYLVTPLYFLWKLIKACFVHNIIRYQIHNSNKKTSAGVLLISLKIYDNLFYLGYNDYGICFLFYCGNDKHSDNGVMAMSWLNKMITWGVTLVILSYEIQSLNSL